MSVSVTFNNAYRSVPGTEFLMARRPVMDRENRVVAQELLFAGAAADAGGDGALQIIEEVCRQGLTRVLGDLKGILRIDESILMSESIAQLPPQRIILEYAPPADVDDAVLDRIVTLATAGYRFTLAAPPGIASHERLLPLVSSLRIDIRHAGESSLRALCQHAHAQGRPLFADHVESVEQFDLCRALGFDYFRGYYFATPRKPAGGTLSPTQAAIIELLALLSSDAADVFVERSIKGNVSLGLNLLRLANTPAFGAHRVDSLRQALMVLGRNQLQCWLQVLLYADTGGTALPALCSLATTRGRLMELIAHKLMPGNRSIGDAAFTVGIMSLMDSLFPMTMDEILRQLPVGEEVAAALLRREGFHGRLLTLVEHAEWRAGPAPYMPALEALKLSCHDLYLLQLSAFEWSDQVTHGLH